MRALKYSCLAIVVLFPAILQAGQVYGTVTSGGKAVSQAAIEISCKGAVTSGATTGDGSYRVNVPQEGQCSLALPTYPGKPSAVIFSNPGPSTYNFDLVLRNDGNYELRRR